MVQLTRECLKYENHSDRYILNDDDLRENCYWRQYFLLYRARLRILGPRIIEAAKQILGFDIEPCPLTKAPKGKSVFIIGTAIKRIKQRPSVLKSIAEQQLILPEAVMCDNLSSEDDFLELEEEDQIVRLAGSISLEDVATGCVMGLIGAQSKDDVFHVEKVIWPTMPMQIPYPKFNADKYVMFISGLSFCGESESDAERLFSLDVMQKWIGGYLPLSVEEQSIVENLVRLIVAGESIAITTEGKEYATAARYLIRNEECPNVECAANMDKFLSKISNILEVDIMPGIGDPTTHQMPQQPIHRAVLPNASRHGKMLNLVTNPYQFSIQDVQFLGTSGESVLDLKRFCADTRNTELMTKILHWQHLAPTVPDTIDGFPFENRDPLIIEDQFPHIFFTANQSETDYTIQDFGDGRRTLLLSVPSFSKTKSAVIINLRTLEVIEQNFCFDDDLVC